VPHEWIYTTVGPKEIKELAIYDRWHGIALRSAPDRYRVMKNLIGLIASERESLVLPFPQEQELAFSLPLVKLNGSVRWSS
jgi:hypothetical protein